MPIIPPVSTLGVLPYKARVTSNKVVGNVRTIGYDIVDADGNIMNSLTTSFIESNQTYSCIRGVRAQIATSIGLQMESDAGGIGPLLDAFVTFGIGWTEPY